MKGPTKKLFHPPCSIDKPKDVRTRRLLEVIPDPMLEVKCEKNHQIGSDDDHYRHLYKAKDKISKPPSLCFKRH